MGPAGSGLLPEHGGLRLSEGLTLEVVNTEARQDGETRDLEVYVQMIT